LYDCYAIGAYATNGKADRQALERSLSKRFEIPGKYMEAIITLLGKFELAIPLDGNTFLIPSLLQSREAKELQFTGRSYNFPCNKTVTLKSKCDSAQNSSSSSLNYSRSSLYTTGTEWLPESAQQRFCTKEIILHSTGMCYRRIFIADCIPKNFWPRLITRFLSSAGNVQKIVCKNCFSNIHCENFLDVSNASIGSLPCKWSYGKNHIMLSLGGDVILCINSLYSLNDVDNKSERISISHTVGKLENMQVYYGNTFFDSINVNDGFEVTIPDYIVHSGPNLDKLVHESKLMSAQILSHVLETINEVLIDWFEGLMEKGIYSNNYLTHFIPCPYCFGDTKPKDIADAIPEEPDLQLYECPCNDIAPNGALVGFSFQYCLLQAREYNFIKCPAAGCALGKRLSLKCLVPDLVSLTLYSYVCSYSY